MMCSKPAIDATEYEPSHCLHEPGETWVYCKACDCWTAHPDQTDRDGIVEGSNSLAAASPVAAGARAVFDLIDAATVALD